MALISVTRACGKCRSASAQKIWMPARHMAIIVQNPDTITRMNNVIVPSRDGVSSIGASIANLARKHDRGGNQARRSAQNRKLKHSLAPGAGNTNRKTEKRKE